MKKHYVKPIMVGEKFLADEYVSACWGVACDTDAANHIERDLDNNPIGGHRKTECGRFDQQAIVTNSNNVATGMVEIGTAFGDLDCDLYTDGTYTEKLDASTVKNGDTIYWITEGNYMGKQIYHHVGKVQLTDQYKVNHS